VRTLVDARLRAEAARFAFRFACEECAHFDPAGQRCSLAYAAAPRRDALRQVHLELCKEFELA
jgi:hypothetical protein